jgi:hypothetical protein
MNIDQAKEQGKRILYVVGAPKSGTTWLCRLMGQILDSPIGGMWKPKMKRYSTPPAQEGEGRQGDYFIVHDHLKKRVSEDDLVVYIYRDPRDVIVSASYYWNSTIEHMVDAVPKRIWPYNHDWKGLTDYWLVEGNSNAIVAYENLIENARFYLKIVLRDLGIAVPATKYVEQHGDQMPLGKVIQASILRKGIVGDWKNHLDREQCRRVSEELFDYMRILGYESDPDWWREI